MPAVVPVSEVLTTANVSALSSYNIATLVSSPRSITIPASLSADPVSPLFNLISGSLMLVTSKFTCADLGLVNGIRFPYIKYLLS